MLFRSLKITVSDDAAENKKDACENTQISQADIRRNKAEIRKINAYIRDRIKALEVEISGLESKKAEMEDSFSQDTSPELYREYSDLLSLIDDNYAEYTALTEEDQSHPILN